MRPAIARLCCVLVTCAGVAAVNPAAHARAAGPTLGGENLVTDTATGGTITVSAVPAGGCTNAKFTFSVTGMTSGPYYIGGTFGATGTFRLGGLVSMVPQPTYAVTAFDETFTITAPAGSATGSKALATPLFSPNLATCSATEVGLHSVNATYTALLNSTVSECGSNQLQLDYVYSAPNGGFNQTFVAGTCASPAPDASISAAGTDVAATEGHAFTGTVATFTDPDTTATAAEYAATITWGDGRSGPGTVTGSNGSFTVQGMHTYADEGVYPIGVTITDTDTSTNHATASGTARVADASLTAAGTPSASPQSFSGVVATFTDANTTTSSANDFTASIDWGDGGTSMGAVSGGAGAYAVSGSHTFSGTGYRTVTVYIRDDGGSRAKATATVLIYAVPAGGSFVIGDREAAPADAVTFWGAQWAKRNPMTGGSGPSSFKGFSDGATTATCGSTWTADPGNSSPPPPGPLPDYMAVLVSSSVSKTGSTIAGNTVEVVVVRTNPGYQPNPGHAGTGTVVQRVC